jgi:hypothetical protein
MDRNIEEQCNAEEGEREKKLTDTDTLFVSKPILAEV